MTLREKPRWSRRANSWALLASQCVYLRSGANGNKSFGPNTWQCASTLPGGSLNSGLLGPAYHSSQPGVFSNAMSGQPRINFYRDVLHVGAGFMPAFKYKQRI